MTYLAGLDVGTGSIKAVLYHVESGRVVAVVRHPTHVYHPRPDWSEFDAAEIWETVARCVREVVAALPAGERIAAVAVGSMGEAGVPLDASGRILDQIIAWYDRRTEPQAEWWRDTFGPARTYDITGHVISPVFTVFKLLWLREHRPIVFAAMERWLCIEDFVIWKLSGEFVTDHSIASRTMMFDQRKRDWSEEVLLHAGIPRSLLPDPMPSGARVGEVTPEAATATGLQVGTPVATGGHDHLCGAFAAGLTAPGGLLDSTGTAESVLLLRDRFVTSADAPQLLAHTNNQYAYVIPGHYVVTGALQSGGGVFGWWVAQCFPDDPDAYDKAIAEAAASPPGARGVFCLPHQRGSGTPHSDLASRMAIVGLRDYHSRGDVSRAVLEGLGYWLRECLDELCSLEAVTAPVVTGIGGATRSPLWMQIKADVSGRSYRVPEVGEAVALGAALLAGVAVGVFPSYEAAAGSVRCPSMRYQPDPDRAARYAEWHRRVYRHLYTSLSRVNHEIDRLFE